VRTEASAHDGQDAFLRIRKHSSQGRPRIERHKGGAQCGLRGAGTAGVPPALLKMRARRPRSQRYACNSRRRPDTGPNLSSP
jgi:hypothetical protein